jgi:hypothetical protein
LSLRRIVAFIGVLAAVLAGPFSLCDGPARALALVHAAADVAYAPNSGGHLHPAAIHEACGGHAYLHRKAAAAVAPRHLSPAMPADWVVLSILRPSVPQYRLPPQTGPPRRPTAPFSPRGPPLPS